MHRRQSGELVNADWCRSTRLHRCKPHIGHSSPKLGIKVHNLASANPAMGHIIQCLGERLERELRSDNRRVWYLTRVTLYMSATTSTKFSTHCSLTLPAASTWSASAISARLVTWTPRTVRPRKQISEGSAPAIAVPICANVNLCSPEITLTEPQGDDDAEVAEERRRGGVRASRASRHDHLYTVSSSHEICLRRVPLHS